MPLFKQETQGLRLLSATMNQWFLYVAEAECAESREEGIENNGIYVIFYMLAGVAGGITFFFLALYLGWSLTLALVAYMLGGGGFVLIAACIIFMRRSASAPKSFKNMGSRRSCGDLDT